VSSDYQYKTTPAKDVVDIQSDAGIEFREIRSNKEK